MTRLPSTPHVLFALDRDADERLRIRCRCELCGDDWQRACDYPERTSWWITKFARLHRHGLAVAE